jgi:hypothetical protein
MPMPSYRNTNYSLIYATLAIMVICCLTFAGPRYIRPATNKILGGIELRNYEKAFQDLQHPVGTTPLSLRTTMGVLTDAEQGCDFFVGEVRQFDGTQESISTAYTDQSVNDVPIQVAFLEDGQLPAQVGAFLPETINTLAGWDLPSGSAGHQMYLVYLLVVGFEGDLKLNCR